MGEGIAVSTYGTDLSGTLANRPTNAPAGITYHASDTNELFMSTGGGSWDNFKSLAQSLTPDNDSAAGSTVLAGTTAADVGAVATDTDDWIVLPALADVPVGHTIKVACNAGGAFEIRTPATSGEKINGQDCDGTKEYLATDTEMISFSKVSATDGWVGTAQTALGAIATAVVPD